MDRWQTVVRAPYDPAIRQLLSQCVAETLADMAFLAKLRTSGKGRSLTIVASCPPRELHAPPMTRWARRAMSYAIDWEHTVLAMGRRRARPKSIETPRRPMALIFVPTFKADGVAWGGLAVVTASMDIDREVVRAAERCAWTITNVVSQVDEPPASAAIAMPRLPPARTVVNSGPCKDSLLQKDILLHELRVPLSAATYALASLAKRQGSDWEGEFEHLVNTAQLGVLEAQSIIRSASQLWSLDTELTEPDIRAVSIGRIVEHVLTLFPTARSRVHLELDEDVPLVAADERRLKHVLTNLLENAVKYSCSHTPIIVGAHLADRDRVLICVHSQERGIPSKQELLLDRHARDRRGAPSDDPTSKGLGLSIARDFIRDMGGHLWIESDGTGSTRVGVMLPLAHV